MIGCTMDELTAKTAKIFIKVFLAFFASLAVQISVVRSGEKYDF